MLPLPASTSCCTKGAALAHPEVRLSGCRLHSKETRCAITCGSQDLVPGTGSDVLRGRKRCQDVLEQTSFVWIGCDGRHRRQPGSHIGGEPHPNSYKPVEQQSTVWDFEMPELKLRTKTKHPTGSHSEWHPQPLHRAIRIVQNVRPLCKGSFCMRIWRSTGMVMVRGLTRKYVGPEFRSPPLGEVGRLT